MRKFRRKKKICKVLKEIFITLGIAGILMILGAAEAADLETSTFEGLLIQIASGCAVMWVSAMLYVITDHFEHQIRTKK